MAFIKSLSFLLIQLTHLSTEEDLIAFTLLHLITAQLKGELNELAPKTKYNCDSVRAPCSNRVSIVLSYTVCEYSVHTTLCTGLMHLQNKDTSFGIKFM